MSRSIQKCDLLTVDLHHISSDMLSDAAGRPVDHVGMTDGIQKGGLSVVYVSHDTDHRRTLLHGALVLFVLLQKLFDDVHHFLLLAQNIKFHGDLFRRIIVDLLIDGGYLSLHKELLYDNRRNDLHLIRKLFDGQKLRKDDLLDLLHRRSLLLRLFRLCCRFLLLALLALVFKF